MLTDACTKKKTWSVASLGLGIQLGSKKYFHDCLTVKLLTIVFSCSSDFISLLLKHVDTKCLSAVLFYV
jgi:hypothetical protein